MTWQPIETAPKDGSPIIGIHWDAESYENKGRIARVWWQPEFDAFISSCREMQMHNGYTFADGSKRKLHSPMIEEVTHWMPFYEPAKQPAEGFGR